MFAFCPKVLFDKQSIQLKVGCPGMAAIAAPQHPTLSRRIRVSTSVILHEQQERLKVLLLLSVYLWSYLAFLVHGRSAYFGGGISLLF